MTNLHNLQISYHFINDRQGRKQRIDAIIGNNWGQPVKEEWYKDAWRILTDVGIIFIVDMDKTKILTYYFATMRVVNGMYGGNNKVPAAMVKRINKNARNYCDLYDTGIRSDKYRKN